MRPGESIANAVVAAINAAPIDVDYVAGVSLPMTANTAAVCKMPRFKLEDLADLKTCVASRSRGMTPAGRGPRQHAVAVQVMLLKKLDSDHTGLDDLLELVYAIDVLLSNQPSLRWVSSNNDPEYDTESLETLCLFKSVLTLNFTLIT